MWQPQGVNGGSQQLQAQALLPQEAGYTSARAEALANVESTIVELGSIFTQLAELVQAQGEATRRIDENVDETLGNVDAAKAQLAKYLAAVSSNRCAACSAQPASACLPVCLGVP
jgi:syntaxin 5